MSGEFATVQQREDGLFSLMVGDKLVTTFDPLDYSGSGNNGIANEVAEQCADVINISVAIREAEAVAEIKRHAKYAADEYKQEIGELKAGTHPATQNLVAEARKKAIEECSVIAEHGVNWKPGLEDAERVQKIVDESCHAISRAIRQLAAREW